MDLVNFEMEWAFCTDGYNLKDEEYDYLIVRKGTKLTRYTPEPGLHRIFSQLRSNPTDVLDFVKKYGFLGANNLSLEEIKRESYKEILRCRDEFNKILFAIDQTFELVRKFKVKAKNIREKGEALPPVENTPFLVLSKLFNDWGKKHREQLEYGIDISMWPWDESSEPGIKFRARPKTLLAYFWLSAAEEIIGRRFNVCATCGKPIPIGGKTGFRIDKKTCSDICRVNKPKNKKK